MDDRLIDVVRRTFKAVVLVVGIGVLLFFALTRTEVGRDQLRRTLEHRFEEAFEGRLAIEELRGNLVNTLFARDVQVYDPRGRLVVHIDSVVARPRWSDLFRRSIAVGRLTLIRPTLSLAYGADSTWNLVRAFHREGPRGEVRAPWTFTSADLVVQDGQVETTRADIRPPLARSGWVWDYGRSAIDDLDLRATIEWHPTFKLIDLLSATARLEVGALPLKALQGQLVIDSTGVQLGEGRLSLGDTDIRVEGTAQPVPGADRSLDHLDAHLTLTESQLDFDALKTLLPRLPLANTARASLEVRGSLSDFTISVDTLASGGSMVAGTAAVRGLPDAVNFDVAFRDSRVAPEDVRALLPDLGATPLDSAGLITFDAEIQGRADSLTPFSTVPFSATTSFDARGRPGRLAGTLDASRTEGGTVTFAMDIQSDSLDLQSVWASATVSSRLNGRFYAEGQGRHVDSLDSRASFRLGPSTIADRPIDTLRAEVAVTDRRLDITLDATSSAGRITAQGDFLRASLPQYAVRLRTYDLDLGPLTGIDTLRTSITAESEWSGMGAIWDYRTNRSRWTSDLQIQVRDTSSVRLGSTVRLLPPHELTLGAGAVRDGVAQLQIGGDALGLTVKGTDKAPILAAAARLWSRAGAQWLHQRLTPEAPPTGMASLRQAQHDLQDVLDASGHGRIELRAELEIKDAPLFAAYLPMWPTLPALNAQTSLRATATEIDGSASLRQAEVKTSTVGLEQINMAATVHGRLALGTASPVFTGTVAATADTVRGGVFFPAPALQGQLTPDALDLQLHTDPTAEAGALRFDASLTFLDRTNRLTITRLTTRIRDYTWELVRSDPMALVADAITVPSLVFTRDAADDAQRISITGTYSRASADTLSLQLTNVQIGPIAELLSTPFSLDATANGTVSLGRFPQPTLTGALRLDTLVLNERILGNVEASSSFVPGSPNLNLTVAVLPLAADSTPDLPFPVTYNDLSMSGTARLPGGADEGLLDLTVEARGVEAFFFEDIFQDLVSTSSGTLQGTGTIQGSFNRPIFGGTFALSDGQVAIPRFGLRYRAEGIAHVDADGITLDQVRLRDPTDGEAIIDGRLLFNDYRFLSFDLSAALDDFEIIDVPRSTVLPFYGHIWASGTATLSGPVFDANLQASEVLTHEDSELFIPVSEAEAASDPGFIVYTDAAGTPPGLATPPDRDETDAAQRRDPRRPRKFIDGLSMDLNITAPAGSEVHLVVDPLLGDVINAVGSGRVQLQLQDDEFSTFGSFNVTSGDYLFTAGEVFVRRFQIDEGTIMWDGDPANARLDIDAAYRTRASRAGLPDDVQSRLQPLIPLIVQLEIRGRATTPLVDLGLTVDRGQRETFQETPYLETLLNQPERSTEYATSVLLTNSFLLTTQGAQGDVLTRSAFNSVSQLVSSQLNRYLGQVAPNLDLTLGVQGEESINELDVTAGLALRLLDQRLVIRGEGVYRGLRQDAVDETQQALQGEFVVEVRLTSNVSVEVFYRRESDVLSESVLTSTTGAGVSYQTQFSTWQRLFRQLLPATEDPVPAAAETDTTSLEQ